jgi:hypothetical protein
MSERMRGNSQRLSEHNNHCAIVAHHSKQVSQRRTLRFHFFIWHSFNVRLDSNRVNGNKREPVRSFIQRVQESSRERERDSWKTRSTRTHPFGFIGYTLQFIRYNSQRDHSALGGMSVQLPLTIPRSNHLLHTQRTVFVRGMMH